jgi:hypothetical protein
MALITKEDVYQYLNQVVPDTASDALLDTICARVDSIISAYLGYTWDAYAPTATTKVVTGAGTPWLSLPPHEPGSVTTVTIEGFTDEIEGWAEESGGALYLTHSYPYSGNAWYGMHGWYVRRYTVTAKWGHGDVPEALKEVAVEMAVNLWRERDQGSFSDVIGVDTGNGTAVGYKRAFTNRQEAILRIYKRKFLAPWVV